MLRRLIGEKFFKDSFVYIVGTLVAGFLGYMFQFVVSRKLSVGDYGELQSIISVFSIMAVFMSAASYFAVKYSSVFAKENDHLGARDFGAWMMAKINKPSFILFVLFMAASPLIYKYLHLSQFYGLIIIGLAVLCALFSSVYSGFLSGWQKFVSVNIVSSGGAFFKLVSGYLIVLFYPTASSVTLAFLVGSAGSWLLGSFLVKKKIYSGKEDVALSQKSDWQGKYFKEINIKKTVMPTIIFSLMIVLISNIDILLLKNLTTAEITGYYGALKILGSIIIAINTSIVSVVLPRACADGGVNKKILLGAYGAIVAISAASTALYFLFPSLIIEMLFGSKYVLFSSDLWLFGIIALAISLLTLESNLAYARYDFHISYILGATATLMVSGLYLFHSSIREAALAAIVSFTIGYFGAIVLNLIHRKRNLAKKEPITLPARPL